jgi:protein-tyrosine-phosphatase
MKQFKILFICKNNKFRSKVAEAYFKKTNKNKNIKVDSAGLFEGGLGNKNANSIIKKLGINIKGKPRTISNKLLTKQDLVIIVADNVPKNIYDKKYCKNLIKWRIEDTEKISKNRIEKIVKKIIKKVDKLNKSKLLKKV